MKLMILLLIVLGAAHALTHASSSIPPDLLQTAKKYIKLVLTSSKDPKSQMQRLMNFWIKTIKAGIGSTLKEKKRDKFIRSSPSEVDELVDTGDPSLKNELIDKAKEMLESGDSNVKSIKDALVLVIGNWMDKMQKEILSVIGTGNDDNGDDKHKLDDRDVMGDKEDIDNTEDINDKQDKEGTGGSLRINEAKDQAVRDTILSKAQKLTRTQGFKNPKDTKEAVQVLLFNWIEKMKKGVVSIVNKNKNSDRIKTRISEDIDSTEDSNDKQDKEGTGGSLRINEAKDQAVRDTILSKAQKLTRTQGFKNPKDTKEAVQVLLFNWIEKMKKGVVSIVNKNENSDRIKTRISEVPRDKNSKLPRLSDQTHVEFFIYTYDTIKNVQCEELSEPNSLYNKDYKPVLYISGAKSKNGKELPLTMVKDFLNKNLNFIYAAYVDGEAPKAPTQDIAIALMHFMNCLHNKLGVDLEDILIKTTAKSSAIGKYIQINNRWLI